MIPTIHTQCSCGALIAVPVFAYPLIRAFTEAHASCITESRNDVDEEQCGDVFTQASLARDHSEPELQTGFQRQLW